MEEPIKKQKAIFKKPPELISTLCRMLFSPPEPVLQDRLLVNNMALLELKQYCILAYSELNISDKVVSIIWHFYLC